MGTAGELDGARTLLARIPDPVHAHPQAIALHPFARRGAGRPQLLVSPKELLPDAPRPSGRHSKQVPGRSGGAANALGHSRAASSPPRSRRSRAARESRSGRDGSPRSSARARRSERPSRARRSLRSRAIRPRMSSCARRGSALHAVKMRSRSGRTGQSTRKKMLKGTARVRESRARASVPG
jgi:hypothetical protein